MTTLDDLVGRGKASVEEVNEALGEITFTRLDDKDLMKITQQLLGFPTIFDAVAKYPGFYKAQFDLVFYYNAVKGTLTPSLTDSHIQRLTKLRRHIGKYVSREKTQARNPHEVIQPPIHSINEVRQHFEDLDICDGRKLTAVLEGMNLALHCPEIVPYHAIQAFRDRWYSVKQFHADYQWGNKTAMELREDGRKDMFLQGVANLNHYLRAHR